MKLEDLRKYPIDKIFEIQKSCYAQKLVMTDTVQAGSKQLSKISVSNYGHFFVEYITGQFQADTGGVCWINGKLIDGCTSRPLFDDYIPLNLFLTPGKIGSTQLFYPLYFPYIFGENGDILFETVNTGTQDFKFSLCFHGYRIQRDGVKI